MIVVDQERYDKALHKLYRAMHDGICPQCGETDDQVKSLLCGFCGFGFTDQEVARVKKSIRNDMTTAMSYVIGLRNAGEPSEFAPDKPGIVLP